MLNVALGGTLIVDISAQMPGALSHCRTDKKDKIVHEVDVEAGSILAKVCGDKKLGVNSSHHQAVGNIAKPLRVTAVSIDGIVEGLELEATGIGADLHFLAQKLADSTGPKPRFFLACGTEDELLPESRAFRQHLEAVHLPVTYEESPGAHEWGYWDAQIQRVLDWLPLR